MAWMSGIRINSRPCNKPRYRWGNTIRPIALGRRNWLFTGSERAGQRAAAIQTLLSTAKLNGLDPAAWLRDTLEKLPTCLNSQIDSLLPFGTQALHRTTS